MRRAALELAAELLARLRGGGVRELALREGALRVRVWRDEAPAAAPAQPAPAPQREPAAAAAQPAKPAAKTVNAPLTGVFYRSPSPQAPPFAEVGSVVAVGDVVGLIEAMKLFNEVRASVGGRVRRVLADNGQLVRAHQPILELE